MSDQPNNTPNNASDNAKVPQSLNVVAQFLKDLSFENPGQGPLSSLQSEAPAININVQVNITKDSKEPTRFCVDLILKAISKIQEKPLFILDVTYTGIFNLVGFDEKLEAQILNVQCPAILFPFIRRIVSEKITEGGYPPLLLDPIDFYAIYMQKNQPQEDTQQNQDDLKAVGN
ncbi:MAG: preprotein translocase subunit SecB [Alphaproteobacteria bacterium]|jgi:preprotein translocase subunit SecB